MQEVKYCQMCHEYLGNIYEMDYYRFISLKYCDRCRDVARRQQKAQYQREYRGDGRKIRRLQKEQIKLLTEENELLRIALEKQRKTR